MSTVPKRRAGRPPDVALKDRRREEILEAAGRLFAERGFSRTTTQVVADYLGVGKGTIYRYFPDKRSLFLAAVDRLMRGLTDAIRGHVDQFEDPLERATLGVRMYLAYFAEHPEFVELLIQERAQFKDRPKPTYFEHRDASIGRWQEVFRSLIAADRIRDIPVERITEVIGDLLYGTMFTNFFAGRNRSPEEQARDILDIVYFGILSESERKAREKMAEGSGERGRGLA